LSQSGLPLQVELANTRTRRIDAILSEYVDPLLLTQGAAGLYRTTFVLVPSTVSSLQDCPSDAFVAPQEAEVVGFPQTEVVKLVRLSGQEHAMEFWRQPAVTAELISSMKARLSASGHRIFEPADAITTTSAPSPPAPQPQLSREPKKKSFWSRVKGMQMADDVIVDRKLGWREPEPHTEGSPGKIPTGLVQVSVVWKDVSLRIANDMGLYESKNGPALCLTVEVGS
jgi:hypothetical protein